MTLDELKYKENVLRDCFKEKLDMLNVEGNNNMCVVKDIKMYGALWHYTHQLLLAEENKDSISVGEPSSAETMEIKATGLKMARR